jgi:hypothetical protein
MMDMNTTAIERPTTPSIFITSHDVIPSSSHNHQQQIYTNHSRPPPILTVQTHNLNHSNSLQNLSPNGLIDQQHSPALSAYHTALNTPVSPSPSSFISDDDIPSLYSSTHNHNPMTPNTFAALNTNNNSTVVNNNNNFILNNMMLM